MDNDNNTVKKEIIKENKAGEGKESFVKIGARKGTLLKIGENYTVKGNIQKQLKYFSN